MDSQDLMQQVLNELRLINGRFDSLETKITSVDERLTGVEKRLNGRLDEVSNRLEIMDKRLEATEAQTAKLSEYHTEVMTKLEENTVDTAYFDKKMSEHERMIFRIKNA